MNARAGKRHLDTPEQERAVAATQEVQNIRQLLQALRLPGIIGGFSGAALLLLTALILDRAFGRDVVIIVPHAPEVVDINRLTYEAGEPVAEIYGLPSRERIILPSGDRIIIPEEDPKLTLLKVDPQAGDHPLQAKTVWFIATRGAPALIILGVIALFFPRKEPVSAPASSA